jgi:hypothetical protein
MTEPDTNNSSEEGFFDKAFDSHGHLEEGEEGLTVFLRINYKVVLLVAVMFDFFHTSLNEIIALFARFV